MTKHHYSTSEREYHDACTYLRIMRHSEVEKGDLGDYYDLERDHVYWEARDHFNALPKEAQCAARRSLAMWGEHERG